MDVTYSERISASGSYAFAELDRKVAELRTQGVDVIDLGVGDPRSPTPGFVMDAIGSGLRRRAAEGYPSYVGEPAFREAVSGYLARRFGVRLDPETEVTSTIGSKEAVFHLPLAFVDPGDLVICPTPGYPPYKTGTRFAGGRPYFVPLLPENGFLIDLDAIPEKIARRAKIVWTNYPNSPTGRAAPRAWLEELVDWSTRHGVIVAADEGCYIDIYFDESPVSILEVATEGVITFYSLSKRSNMTNCRVGACAGDRRLIDGLRRVKTNIDSGTPAFIQDGAIEALRDDEHVRRLREEYGRKLRVICDAFEAAGLPRCESEATFYVWQCAPAGVSGVQLTTALLDEGIVVAPGSWLSDPTEDGVNPGTDYVRLALVAPDDEIEEAARRISRLTF